MARPGQTLADHHNAVGAESYELGEPLGLGRTAEFIGRGHDNGKKTTRFQQMIETATRLGPCFHQQLSARDIEQCGKYGPLLAVILRCHHGGLNNVDDAGAINDEELVIAIGEHIMDDPEMRALFIELVKELDAFFKRIDARTCAYCQNSNLLEVELLDRMLLSMLCNADRHNAACQNDPEDAAKRFARRKIDALVASNHLDEHMVQVRAHSKSGNAVIQAARDIVYKACDRAGHGKPGIYNLAAPTGVGKTLASLRWGVEQCIKHGFNRIIYVEPYVTIANGVAGVCVSVIGKDGVLEHTSAFGFDGTSRDMNNNNWFVPCVVTTSVQFFESLFATGTTKLLKLRAMVNTAIIIDEYQAMPVRCLRPAMASLAALVHDYHCSVLLMSATAPNLDFLFCRTSRDVQHGYRDLDYGNVLTDDEKAQVDSAFANRVRYVDLGADETPESLVGRIAPDRSTLVVCNTRSQVRACARAFAEVVGDRPWFCLSRDMVASHRAEVLRQVEELLSAGEPVVLFATSIVEAGVDLDFDEGFRCHASIDSIVQSAGRVNRNGRLDTATVYLFDFADAELASRSWAQLKQWQQQTLSAMLSAGGLTPEALEIYFRNKYAPSAITWPDEMRDFDAAQGRDPYRPGHAHRHLNFVEHEKGMRMIVDADYGRVPVIVPYEGEVDLEAVSRSERKLEKHSVAVTSTELDALVADGYVREVEVGTDDVVEGERSDKGASVYVLTESGMSACYSDMYGFGIE